MFIGLHACLLKGVVQEEDTKIKLLCGSLLCYLLISSKTMDECGKPKRDVQKRYTPRKVNVLADQEEKLKKAIKMGKGSSIKFKIIS